MPVQLRAHSRGIERIPLRRFCSTVPVGSWSPLSSLIFCATIAHSLLPRPRNRFLSRSRAPAWECMPYGLSLDSFDSMLHKPMFFACCLELPATECLRPSQHRCLIPQDGVITSP